MTYSKWQTVNFLQPGIQNPDQGKIILAEMVDGVETYVVVNGAQQTWILTDSDITGVA